MAQYLTYQDQSISVGDTVAIHQKIQEGNKSRIQIFEGIVISIQNRAENKSFTVRKIASGAIGVEKIFPVALPSISKIQIKRHGAVRRAKLYYLRDRIGKSANKVREKKINTTAPKKA